MEDGIRAGITIVWIVTVIVTIDAWRRPRTQWLAADRNRGWWLSGLTVSSLMLLPAIVFVPAYLFGVLPVFASPRASAGRSAVDEFRRR
ncbi:MAG: hypothetical protein ABMA25_19630 [Ilumatobacteraceae bacterium]